MIATIRSLSKASWLLALVLGASLGYMVSFSQLATNLSFLIRPVAVMQGELVERTQNAVTIHMWGTKLRGSECVYKGVDAFGDRVVGLPADLFIERVGMPEAGNTKPQGSYDIGYWKIWPVDGVTKVRIYVTHDCNGDMRATEIARVAI